MLVSGNASIVNADVNASAAIAGTKISPDFGSQTITTTGIVSAALGAAATPSITFTGDTNTGIYSPGADQVAISTNGTGRLFVDASGNVQFGGSSGFFFVSATNQIAIGGNTYTKDLTISKTDAAIALRASSGGTYSSQGLFFYVDGTAQSQIHNDGGGNILFRNTSALTERMRLDSSGRLGLGTSSPGALLSINSSYAGYGLAAITDGSPLVAITGGRDKFIRIDGGAYQGGTSTASIHLSNSGASNYNLASGHLLQSG
jgi:hypothetical protein